MIKAGVGVQQNIAEPRKAAQEALGMDPPMIGLYTYGEQGPLLGKKGKPAYFHNETMTMLVVGE